MIELDPNGVWARSPRWARWTLVLAAIFFLLVVILVAATHEPEFLPRVERP